MLLQDARFGWLGSVIGVLVVCGLAGCAGRPSLLPNRDKDLRKTSVAFAADAAKRSYPESAPRGAEAQAQASVDHGLANRIEVINLSDENWTNVELWVNGKYVVFIPNWPSRRMEQVNFQMLYDREGGSFPVDNKNVRVATIEIFVDGKLHAVPARLVD
ncbi:MAG: hypothetical protein JWN40_3609 [Phycisphaerales bacterium]|nr:hypothetical protein [Phycisphaerales bacterium]